MNFVSASRYASSRAALALLLVEVMLLVEGGALSRRRCWLASLERQTNGKLLSDIVQSKESEICVRTPTKSRYFSHANGKSFSTSATELQLRQNSHRDLVTVTWDGMSVDVIFSISTLFYPEGFAKGHPPSMRERHSKCVIIYFSIIKLK